MEFFDAIANMSALSFAQHMVNGISLGSLYALIAIGYTMVYGILLMINFAHGRHCNDGMLFCFFRNYGFSYSVVFYFYHNNYYDGAAWCVNRAQCLPPAP